MAMTRYKEVFAQMLEQNKDAFDEFQKIHDQYALDDSIQEKYNEEGKKIQTIIQKYEDILCGRSESTGYGSYTGGLSEKFHNEIRKKFPKIDYIGIKTFNINKINLQK